MSHQPPAQPVLPVPITSLDSWCSKVPTTLALDTEFMWRTTYAPQPALIQLCAGGDVYLYDALTGTAYDDRVHGGGDEAQHRRGRSHAVSRANQIDKDALGRLLMDDRCLKLLFAAHDDLVVLHRMFGCLPATFVDVQYAAFFCGVTTQLGLEKTLEIEFGVMLDKKHQDSDWLRRPLGLGQLTYAMQDVVYLERLWHKRANILRERGYVDWLEEDMMALHDKVATPKDPTMAWRFIPPRSSFPRSMALLQALAAWREETAARLDKHVDRIISSADVAHVAALPSLVAATCVDKDLWQRLLKEYGGRYLSQKKEASSMLESLWPMLEAAYALPPSACPQWPHHRMTDKEVATLRRVKKIVGKVAAELDIPSFILASKRQLDKFCRGLPNALEKGWRHDVLSHRLG